MRRRKGLRQIESLRQMIAVDYQLGLITSAEVREKLDGRLGEAQKKLVKEDAKKVIEELNKFIADVDKERGKKLTAVEADKLIQRAQTIIVYLKGRAP